MNLSRLIISSFLFSNLLLADVTILNSEFGECAAGVEHCLSQSILVADPEVSPSEIESPSPTPSPSTTVSPSSTPSPSVSASPSPSDSVSPTPSASLSATPSPTVTVSATPSVSESPTSTQVNPDGSKTELQRTIEKIKSRLAYLYRQLAKLQAQLRNARVKRRSSLLIANKIREIKREIRVLNNRLSEILRNKRNNLDSQVALAASLPVFDVIAIENYYGSGTSLKMPIQITQEVIDSAGNTLQTLPRSANLAVGQQHAITLGASGTGIRFTAVSAFPSIASYIPGTYHAVANDHSTRAMVLVNGDSFSSLALQKGVVNPVDGQVSVNSILSQYLDGQGKIILPQGEFLILFELGSASPGQSGFDFQDLIIKVSGIGNVNPKHECLVLGTNGFAPQDTISTTATYRKGSRITTIFDMFDAKPNNGITGIEVKQNGSSQLKKLSLLVSPADGVSGNTNMQVANHYLLLWKRSQYFADAIPSAVININAGLQATSYTLDASGRTVPTVQYCAACGPLYTNDTYANAYRLEFDLSLIPSLQQALSQDDWVIAYSNAGAGAGYLAVLFSSVTSAPYPMYSRHETTAGIYNAPDYLAKVFGHPTPTTFPRSYAMNLTELKTSCN